MLNRANYINYPTMVDAFRMLKAKGYGARRAYCLLRYGAMVATGYENSFHLQGSKCRPPDTSGGHTAN